jgi:hypothetical protein
VRPVIPGRRASGEPAIQALSIVELTLWIPGSVLLLLRHKFVGCAKSRREGLAACATALRDFAHAIGEEPRGCAPYLRAWAGKERTLWFARPERDRLRSDRVVVTADVRLIRLLREEIPNVELFVSARIARDSATPRRRICDRPW